MARLMRYSILPSGKDYGFILKMLFRSFFYSPTYFAQALLRSPTLASEMLWEKLEESAHVV
jgi:hypothetical protein